MKLKSRLNVETLLLKVKPKIIMPLPGYSMYSKEEIEKLLNGHLIYLSRFSIDDLLFLFRRHDIFQDLEEDKHNWRSFICSKGVLFIEMACCLKEFIPHIISSSKTCEMMLDVRARPPKSRSDFYDPSKVDPRNKGMQFWRLNLTIKNGKKEAYLTGKHDDLHTIYSSRLKIADHCPLDEINIWIFNSYDKNNFKYKVLMLQEEYIELIRRGFIDVNKIKPDYFQAIINVIDFIENGGKS